MMGRVADFLLGMCLVVGFCLGWLWDLITSKE